MGWLARGPEVICRVAVLKLKLFLHQHQHERRKHGDEQQRQFQQIGAEAEDRLQRPLSPGMEAQL